MRHLDYVAFARRLAERHIEIQHTEKACHFLRVHLSADPIQYQLDLREFYNSLRTKLKPGVFMILQSYEAEYQDNGGDNRSKKLSGAILILDKAKGAAPDVIDEVYDRTERIGEEIMGAWLHYWYAPYDNPLKAQMRPEDITAEKVGPVSDDFHGTRFSFSFTAPANQGLHYNPDQFLAE